MKKDVPKNSKIGDNIGICRQWKLSEFDMIGNKLMMKKGKSYNRNGLCVQAKQSVPKPPRSIEIPIWSSSKTEGYIDLTKLDTLSLNDGGTAVIIWTTEENETLFIDIHGSIKEIIDKALEVKKYYNVDPSIGIHDAGTFARKFRSNSKSSLNFKIVNSWTGDGLYVGAGYAYLIM